MSKTFARFLATAVTALTKVQRPERAERNRLMVRDLLTERHTIETQRGQITLLCKERREVHYAHHFFDREPAALKWIDGFEAPCTFWDVGANTGIYSLYSALSDGVSVFAFEPAASTYGALYANIHANSLDDRITGLCMGFFDKTVLCELRMSAIEAGSAMHDFGGLSAPSEEDDQARHVQKALTFSMDDFRRIYQLEPPNYLKIDVDGVEEEILQGATETLDDKRVRSVLIEQATDDGAANKRVIEFFESHGIGKRTEFKEEHNVVFSR